MRTLAEMRTMTRRHLNDMSTDVFSPDRIDGAIEDALNTLAYDLLAHPIGSRLLRTQTEAISLSAGTEEYTIPEDCIKVDRVWYRESPDAKRWKAAEYRSPQPGKTPPPFYWFNGTDAVRIMIWPAMASWNEEEYKLRYFRRPKFPVSDTATFNDPDDTGSNTDNYPAPMDRAVEYKAAAILAGEESLAQAGIQFFEQLYQGRVTSMVQAVPMTWPDKQYMRRAAAIERNQED